jgi:hypothetical protein
MTNLLTTVATEILVTQMTLVPMIPMKMVVKNRTHLTQIGLSRHFSSFLAVLGIYAETMPRSPKKSKSGNLILLMVPTPENSETF